MKVALIGASGFVGNSVLTELLSRGHSVTALVRNPESLVASENLNVKKVNVYSTQEITDAVNGNDVVINAFNASLESPTYATDYISGSKTIQEGVDQSNVKRLFVIGGAGSLFTADGIQLVDTPEFPAFVKVQASAVRDYLVILKEEQKLDWTFLSPPIEFRKENPGVRTGVYRTGLENPVFDENHRSRISVEDLAVAIVDEIENPKHNKKRSTVGY
jgi:uncharacterized protein